MPRKKRPPPLPGALKKAVLGDTLPPQLAEVVSEFVHMAGGTKGIAKLLFDQYNHPGCSLMQKSRIMQLVVYGMKFVNKEAGGKEPLGHVGEEDLVREAQELMAKVGAAGAAAEKGEDGGGEGAAEPGGACPA